MHNFWQASKRWPLAGQLAFAVLVILIAAVISSGISNALHGRDRRTAVTGASATTSTTSRRPANTATSVALPSTVTTATVRSTTTTKVPPASVTTTRPSASAKLNQLAIADPSHQDAYNRDADFGGWVDADHDCQNTRAEVLIETSQATVSFTTSSHCTAAAGRWVDPWSGAITTTAHDFDIDHTVPLANAWRSGAWSWAHAQRVAYANDLADADHLIAIVASENRSKGDDGPEQWQPPNRNSWCRYALDWDHIKYRWHLTATLTEWNALTEMAATC